MPMLSAKIVLTKIFVHPWGLDGRSDDSRDVTSSQRIMHNNGK